MVDTFFSYFSRLKPNLTKSKTAGIGVLKEVQGPVCVMHCIDLNNDTSNNDIENIQYQKSDTRRENCYFENNSDMTNRFESFITINPKHTVNELETY